MTRAAEITRETKETGVRLSLTLDGSGAGERQTGVGFFDHMLDLLARHGRLDLAADVRGDLGTGAHHTVEDTGIVLGQALDRALGDRVGITRYGHAVVPMDEARASVALDLSGRPYCHFDAALPAGAIGNFDHELAEEFFRAVANGARMTLHVTAEAGTNVHHIIEAMFKAFARALRIAVSIDPTETGVPSTKGDAHGMTVIGVVDYGMGNRRSMEKALERTGAVVVLTGDHQVLGNADGLVLPGVGAFRAAMHQLEARGLDVLVRQRAAAGVPLLGSCLGMQLLFERSDELGGADGLGLLPGEIVRLETHGLKLPHIGWNDVRWVRPSPLTDGLPDPSCFYHVHSYMPRPSEDDVILGLSDYGAPFPSVVGRGNVLGTQFHPEKSSAHGLALLANFVRACARPEAAAA